MLTIKNLAFLLLTAIAFVSCSSDDDGQRTAEEIIAENEEAIQNYLEDNNIDAIATGTGLYYIIHQEGNGVSPATNSAIRVNYAGYNLNDEIFDQGEDVQFNLEQLYAGWQEGLPYFSEGASGQLFIPSYLAAYNSNPSFGMPVVFDIDLLEVID